MKAKFWVSMTDRFMSGWGPARGFRNRLVIGCESMSQAETVRINAEDRSEMEDVLIHVTEPIYDQRVYFVSYHDTEDYSTWKRKDRPFFKRGKDWEADDLLGYFPGISARELPNKKEKT